MSWQLSSFVLLGVALVAGFAWYERSHPSSKVLALVATLAALAVLGRVAFAPLPNVKPSLDIVLLAGYALGGAPGFVVGAVGALASNLFFGQGPWTPWQMASWGAVGLVGAGLARAFGHELGRSSLAAAAGASGLFVGVFMDLHLWVLYTGHSLGELGVILARGVPFTLALAVGNVLFCLAFGPLLVRALRRFRTRFDVDWGPPAPPAPPAPAAPAPGPVVTGAAALLAAVVLTAAFAAPSARADATTDRAVAYLERVQQRDGGFGDRLHSDWAVMGLAAAGRHPADVARGGRSAAAAAIARAGAARETADIERTILALRAAGASTRTLARRLATRRRPDGSFSGLVNQTAFAVLALRASGRSTGDRTVAAAARWLAGQQNRDGGYNFGGRGGPSGIDDTAAVVQALAAAGRRGSPAVRRALAWIVRRQGRDGGFPLSPGMPSNAQSTAWAVQALIAAGRDPDRVRRGASRSPLAYLRTLQAADGSIRYSRTSRQTPVWVTGQALAALARRPLPVRAPARARRAGAPGGGVAEDASAAEAEARSAAAARRARERRARERRARERRRTAARRTRARRRAVAARTERALARRAHQAGVLTALVLAPLTGSAGS